MLYRKWILKYHIQIWFSLEWTSFIGALRREPGHVGANPT